MRSAKVSNFRFSILKISNTLNVDLDVPGDYVRQGEGVGLCAWRLAGKAAGHSAVDADSAGDDNRRGDGHGVAGFGTGEIPYRIAIRFANGDIEIVLMTDGAAREVTDADDTGALVTDRL